MAMNTAAPREDDFMEHRWGQRFNVAIEARLHLRQPYTARRGRVANISASGAFIQTNIPIPVLTCIQVEIQMPTDGARGSLRLPASVVRRTREGVGVEWCEAESFVIADVVASYGKSTPTPIAAAVPDAAAPAAATVLPEASGYNRPRIDSLGPI